MTVDPSSQSGDHSGDQSIANLLEKIARDVDAGKEVEIESVAAEYPEYADRLRELAPAMQALAGWAERTASFASDEQGNLTQHSKAYPEVGEFVRYFGDYEILEEIARGGMGVVYKARQLTLDRIVALKMVLSGELASSQELDRFRAEAQAAANLDHPGIVPIFEVGEHNGRHYFSMGYVEGDSLADRVKDGPLDPQQSAEIMGKVSTAINYAHQQGVIHRDLKPGNVLLDSRDEPRVTDFGLAKQVESNSDLTNTGQVLGTPAYMPPEQAGGDLDKIDARSDVYSLGATLYCLLTGRPPFQAANPVDTLMQVLGVEPASPRKLNPAVPADLDTISLKCLEKEPDRRYQTAQEVVDELDRYLRKEPILARPIGRAARTWRWCKRRPAVAALIALIVGLVGFLSIAGPAMAVRESNLRATAEQQRVRAEENEEKAEQARSLADEQRRKAESAVADEKLARAKEKKAKESALAAQNALVTEKEKSDRTLYARTVSLAYQAWRGDDVHRAEDLLDKADRRFRDWEWNFVKKLCNSEKQTLRGHKSIPVRLRFNVDGKHMVSIGNAASDKSVYVWNIETGDLIKRYPYRGFAISPDGSLVAIEKKSNGPVSIINVFTSDEIVRLEPHAGGTSTASFSSDGKRIVTNGPDKTIRIWDVTSGEKLKTIEDPARREVSDVSLSPDGRYLVWMRRSDGLIKIVSVESGETAKEIQVPLYRKDTQRVAVSPDSTILAAATTGAIRLFDLTTGSQVGSLNGHRSSVYGLEFSADGKRLVSCGIDQTVRVWDVSRKIEILRCRGHKAGYVYGVFDVTFSHDGKWIASGGADTTIKIWSADAWDGNPRSLEQEAGTSSHARVASDVYPNPSQEADWLLGHSHWIDESTFSPDGNLLATASEDDTVKVFDVKTREILSTFDKHQENISAIAFHPKGNLIASGSGGLKDKRGGWVLLWDHRSREVRQKLIGLSGPISSLKFDPTGRLLYASSGSMAKVDTGEVICWDTSTGEQLFKNEEFKGVVRMDLSSDGQLIAIATHDNKIYVLNGKTGSVLREIGTGVRLFYTVAFSPNGKRLVAGSNRWDVSVFDVASGKLLWQKIEHSGAVLSAVYNPTGTRIVSGSVDRTVKLWDSDSGDLLLDFPGDGFELFNVTFSPDGKTIASVGEAPYVTLRSLENTQKQLGVSDSIDQWPVIFRDDFERSELGDQWRTINGKWEIQGGAAKGTLTPLASYPSIALASIVPKTWMPSEVKIAFEAWSPDEIAFETAMLNTSLDSGFDSLHLSSVTPWNQGRRGMVILMTTNGAYTELARVENSDWFQPNKKHKFMTIRHRDSWEMFVDGKSVLEAKVPSAMWTPLLLLQGSLGKEGATWFVDNLVVSAPLSTVNEISATQLVWELSQKLILKSRVVDAIEARTDLPAEVRDLAVRFAKADQAKEDPAQFDKASWAVCIELERDPDDYVRAVRLSQAARHLEPDNWKFLATLGLAQYRAGDYEGAIETTRRSETLRREQLGSAAPRHFAILSMALHKLDRTAESWKAMIRLRDLMKSEAWGRDQIAQGLFQEAKQVMADPLANETVLERELEKIKGALFRDDQAGWLHYDLNSYMDMWSDDVTFTRGRKEKSDQYDLTLDRQRNRRRLSIRFQGQPPPGVSFSYETVESVINDERASLHVIRSIWYNGGFENYGVSYRLHKMPTGWKIYETRSWPVDRKRGSQLLSYTNETWRKLDVEIAELREVGDLRKLVEVLKYGFRIADAYNVTKELTELQDATPTDWSLRGEMALKAGDVDDSIRAFKKALSLDPTTRVPDYRELAVFAPTNFQLSEVDLASDQEGKVRSSGGNATSTLIFQNKTPYTLDYWWIDFNGERDSRGFERIHPGGTAEQSTFRGHVFLVSDTQGRGLGMFKSTKKSRTIALHEASTEE